jgi:hypothetical protein
MMAITPPPGKGLDVLRGAGSRLKSIFAFYSEKVLRRIIIYSV